MSNRHTREAFIIAHGARASAHDVASVLGLRVDDVVRVRATRPCVAQAKPKTFAELFTLWHGRAPEEADWPAPRMAQSGHYEWQAPELALLATLVGQLGIADICEVLTQRLRQRTGNAFAERTKNAVQTHINDIGLQSTDVVGGITISEAARQIGSLAIVQRAVANKVLGGRRVGRLWVIPHEQWVRWKARRLPPPDDYVRLSTLREPMGIKSDKLSEFARMGYIPSAQRFNPCGGGPSTKWGTWFIERSIAAKLLADRRTGLPMPWHGKAISDNLRVTYKLWQARAHPPPCKTCKGIWGKRGAPKTFDDYANRYPPLAHGAKRHLTRVWSRGLLISEVASLVPCSESRVRRAIANGALSATRHGKTPYVSRTDATRWRARKCPTGASEKSWITLETASEQYLFTVSELRRFIADKTLASKTGTNGAMRGRKYVLRHQCGQLREQLGFSEAVAARRAGVSVASLRKLLEGVNWRRANGIPLATLQAVIKRTKSRCGFTVDETASAVGQTSDWVQARIADGTVKVKMSKWSERKYLTASMVKRLRLVVNKPATSDKHIGAQWLGLGQAAIEAGVSVTTLNCWGAALELPRRKMPCGWRYLRDDVRSRARRYWETIHFHRAAMPKWIIEEHKRQPHKPEAGRSGAQTRMSNPTTASLQSIGSQRI